jgi:hypothetical protein
MVLSIIACVMQAWCGLDGDEVEAAVDLGILLIPFGRHLHWPGTA